MDAADRRLDFGGYHGACLHTAAGLAGLGIGVGTAVLAAPHLPRGHGAGGGALGRLDAEGFLTITGRLKDVIIRKGENISAKEVEDHLYEHPKVADVVVIGLPDEERGERVCAVVACADPGDPLVFDELEPFLTGRGVARQKIPEQLELLETLPRNASGKVLKHQLREQLGTRPKF